ncbi:hypothetical protein [Photobacterium leiognathi]|uniref:hypothetical protein n=1 Tax=Photobacterium leiognathi TaxID=553611 RepID=UPI002980A8D3|nr:hypothetical protein [Photobacterium leiognathi]
MKLMVDESQYNLIPSAEYPPRESTIICKRKLKDGTLEDVLFSDDVWDFSIYDLSNIKKARMKMVFNKIPDKFKDDIKKRVYLILFPNTDTYLGDRKNVSISVTCSNVRNISVCANLLNDIAVSFTQLQHEMIFDTFCQNLKEKGYSQITIESRLTALSWLTEANKYLDKKDRIYFPNFERSKLAKELSDKSKGGSHPVIIPEVMNGLYAYFINEIETWHERRLELRDIVKFATENNITHYEVNNFKRKLTAIGYVTLMAFSGMRVSEVVNIQPDSFSDIEFDGIHFYTLKSKTIKLENGIPRTDIWCCSSICEKAIDIIFDIWDRKHEHGKPNSIESYPFRSINVNIENIKDKVSYTTLNTSNLTTLIQLLSKELKWKVEPEWLDSYHQFNKSTSKSVYPIKENADGTLWWHFNNHTFRRTFAFFAVGSGTSSISSIKQQFKHIYIGMSGIYSKDNEILTLLNMVKDKSLMKEIDNAKMDYDSEYLKETLSVKSTNTGGFKDKVLGKEEPKIYTEEQFNALQSDSLTASRSTGYGRCFSKEECKMRHLFEPSGCVANNCDGLSINKNEALRWKERHKKHSNYLKKLIQSGVYSSNQYSRYILDIRAAEKVMADHNIEFSKFDTNLL